ncbi:tyrosine-type recombinase/integrase [Alkalibaculum sp. M08DMB]|uniref:Tyrosine-type recombinase/integrase n=1 Tax=Alkalibaculum sporogenes TaxID=2655001 RepID=A0A6A7KA10_9FIRM|nr:site-specific integrase [Alkalibaculum sporogenes]MPW26226.1 tyrosine-type recombinase/integrase [Alkalibaculum sporogenes]
MAKKTNYTKNGNDYFRVTLTTGRNEEGKPIRKEFYGSSKRDAESKRNEYIKMKELGIDPNLANHSLNEAMHTWLWEIEKSSGHKASTFQRYEGIYRNYIKGSDIATLKVGDIRALSLQRYYNKLAELDKTYSQINNLNKFLSKFFNYAVNEKYLIGNPCRSTNIPVRKVESEIEIFTNGEIKNIMEKLETDRIGVLTKLALGTGARLGELLALTWDDLDLDNTNVVINKSAKMNKIFKNENEWEYEIKVDDPKTYSSNRKIPFPSELLGDIKKQRINNNIEKLKEGEGYVENNLVFPSLAGTLMDESNVGKAHRKILKKSGVDHKKFHAYRHTFVSVMQSRGVPLETISKLIGHKTYRTTVDTYLHVSIEDAGQAINRMNDLFVKAK